MTKLQPPVGTVIETQEEAIRVLLSDTYAEFFEQHWDDLLADANGRPVNIDDVEYGQNLPYTVTGVLEGFTPDPNYGKTKLVEVPADAPTDRWLDVADAIDKGELKHRESYLILVDRGLRADKGIMDYLLPRSGLHIADYVLDEDGDAGFSVPGVHFNADIVAAIKPLSWVHNPKSSDAIADAKRFAGVKTWEGGEDA
jgi:hypothetical protein